MNGVTDVELVARHHIAERVAGARRAAGVSARPGGPGLAAALRHLVAPGAGRSLMQEARGDAG